MPEDKKSDPLATNIAQQVIDQALASVDRHTVKNEAEPAAPNAAPAAPAIEGAPTPKAVGDQPSRPVAPEAEDPARLKADLLQARQALRGREAELEASQAMGRDTLDKLKDQHERTLRAIADLDNYKKRAAREREEQNKFGQERLLRELLPVIDNLDRALEHGKSAADFESLRSGIEMTRKLFEATLGKFGVKGFSAAGQPFDPKLHEAMQSVESEAPAGTVVMELVRGYTLNERLLRPAMVAVATAKAPQRASSDGNRAAATATGKPGDGAGAPGADAGESATNGSKG